MTTGQNKVGATIGQTRQELGNLTRGRGQGADKEMQKLINEHGRDER